ncbi:unnamed protein product [Vicia faba]|uniref:ABC transporter domain-containing protein n=1 Tax=Vicia faba TaxID=3906 RepID=A0AAV0YI98_VICFA|nr:unnamed protein product [Vicia faba]
MPIHHFTDQSNNNTFRSILPDSPDPNSKHDSDPNQLHQPTSSKMFPSQLTLLRFSPLKLSAYVPQHDACLPMLTVVETFAFSASLLKPKTIDISSIVSSLLNELRLTHLANTRLNHGLSGGEHRRVSIGLSLLHDPAVLLLDEPTSGLDSSSAFKVMQTLKSTCVSYNRTIVLSIHQPSFKILSCIDRILLLSKGTVVHHGSLASLQSFLHSKGFTVPHQLNALEYAMEILNQLKEGKRKGGVMNILSQYPSPASFSSDHAFVQQIASSSIPQIRTTLQRSRLDNRCDLTQAAAEAPSTQATRLNHNISISTPFVSSLMDTVSKSSMASAMAALGAAFGSTHIFFHQGKGQLTIKCHLLPLSAMTVC